MILVQTYWKENTGQAICIIALLVVLIILAICSFVLRKDKIKRKPKKASITVGNAQWIGTREKQDDSFATAVTPYGILGIVADGIGGFLNGNIASKITVDTYVEQFYEKDINGGTSYYFQFSAKEANVRIRKQFEESPCGTNAEIGRAQV